MKPAADAVHAVCPTPLGEVLLLATPAGLAGAWFVHDQKDTPRVDGLGPAAPGHPVLAEAARQLADYFGGRRQGFELPLDLSAGTEFQQSVWRALMAIAPGAADSYGAIAARIGRPGAVRAVGSAIGDNPLSVIVPCHRVLGAGGALTGYAGGLARKAALLRLEGWSVGSEGAEPTPRWRPTRPAS